jgi:hypothetical protein
VSKIRELPAKEFLPRVETLIFYHILPRAARLDFILARLDKKLFASFEKNEGLQSFAHARSRCFRLEMCNSKNRDFSTVAVLT